MNFWDRVVGWFEPKPSGPEIDNFLLVDAWTKVYRGGQPTTAAEWQQLADLGLGTVVKLNEDAEAVDLPPSAVSLVKLPISIVDQTFGAPAEATIDLAVSYLAQGRCFVHCEHGQDRTGLVVAVYRVRVQGWPKLRAQTEMMANGFHPLLAGLANYWRDKV